MFIYFIIKHYKNLNGTHYDILFDNEIRALTKEEIKLFCESGSKVIKKESVNKNVNIRDLIMNLSSSRSDSRDTWLRVGYFLSKYPDGEEIFLEFSKKSKKFNASRHNIDWESFKDSESSITLGTILHWLQEDAPEYYSKIKNNEQQIITELNIISKPYSIINNQIIKKSKEYIETSIFSNKLLENNHTLTSKKCLEHDLFLHTTKDRVFCKCRNCSYQYPDNGIIITKDSAPFIYNTFSYR